MVEYGPRIVRMPKVPVEGVDEYYGVMDEDLPFDDTEGKPFSIWEIDETGAWVDTHNDVPKVLPPFVLQGGMVRYGVRIKVKRRGGRWFVADFPEHMKGRVTVAIPVGGEGSVEVGGSVFTGVKAANMQTSLIPAWAQVRISLQDDGLFYVDLAPC